MAFSTSAPPWGFFGHRKINRQAVFTLPPEMMYFFKTNIDFLTEHAVDPDKRRYASKFEAVRHYIDLDVHGEPPFDNLPRNWPDALLRFSDFYFINNVGDTLELAERDPLGHFIQNDGKIALHPALAETAQSVGAKDFRYFFIKEFLPNYYEEEWTASPDSLARLLRIGSGSLHCQKLFAVDHLSEHGILPWNLQSMLFRLTRAFSEGDPNRIRHYAADIGHYIGDAHVPLHTTENYNGQLTGQLGIHAFWESRLPELFADDNYDFWVGKAQMIEDPETYFWDIVMESHSYVDSVLAIELDLRQHFPSDQQMCHEMRNGVLTRTQCEAMAAAYSKRMDGMVEDRMRKAILAVGSVWYTAWVLAGQPDLSALGQEVALVDSIDLQLDKAVKKGTIKGRKHE
ncbi:MAG TPA: hypothetical protein ENJ95_20255 [Bacteroidetes bacterium]|nr:hypothetical protein [Bacteroidota bacterium]